MSTATVWEPHALLMKNALLAKNETVSATVVADIGIVDGRRWATVSVGGAERRAFWPGNLPRQPVAGYGVKVQRMDARPDSPLVVVLTLFQCGLVSTGDPTAFGLGVFGTGVFGR